MKLGRLKFATALGSAAFLAMTLSLATGAAGSSAETTGATAVSSTAAINSDGSCVTSAKRMADSVTAVPDSTMKAQTVTFDVNGTVITEKIPVGELSPEVASDAELDYFGIPARPTGEAELKSWRSEWVDNFTTMEIGVPCMPSTGKSASVTSPNWSGNVSTAGGITEAHGATVWKSSNPCTVTNSWTNWVGVGGWNGERRLIQNGFWQDSSGSHPYYEALNSTSDTNVSAVSIAGASLGDSFALATDYGDYTAGQVQWTWHDLTTGALVELDASTILGQPASAFYSGATGEVIDERGTIGGTYTALRNFGTDNWTQAQVKKSGVYTNIRSTTHTDVDLKRAASIISVYSAPLTDQGSFTDTWQSCGGVG